MRKALALLVLMFAVRSTYGQDVIGPKPTNSAAAVIPLPAGPLGELDKRFVQSYLEHAKTVKNHFPPYIVVSGSSLILHKDGTKDSVHVIPDQYHSLKAAAHFPFTIYLQLVDVTGGSPLTRETQNILNDDLIALAAAHDEFSEASLTDEQTRRSTEIVDSGKALIQQVLADNQVSTRALQDFARKLGPLMLANAKDAGCYQINATHQQVMRWKKMMSADEWKSIRVVSRARHQARFMNAGTQYFSWLLREHGPRWAYPGEGMRVIYAEALGPQEDTTDVLASVLIDADASRAFFGDEWRLSEDILSRGAKSCIAKLPKGDRD